MKVTVDVGNDEKKSKKKDFTKEESKIWFSKISVSIYSTSLMCVYYFEQMSYYQIVLKPG